MPSKQVQRPDAPESASDASASGPGTSRASFDERPKGQHRAQIEARAYELASRRGFEPGHELEDWLQAEREVEAGPPRNTPPDNPFDTVVTRSNE